MTWKDSLKQATSPRQLINHLAHAGIAVLVAIPFLYGFSLPSWAQYILAIGFGFTAKEVAELAKRWAKGEDLHMADSLLDLAVVLAVAIGALFLSPVTAGLVGGGLLAGFFLLRKRFPA